MNPQEPVFDDTVTDPGNIRDWLYGCFKDHESCQPIAAQFPRYDSHGNPRAGVSDLYFVDVINDRIVKGDIRWRYAALSYVWGEAAQTVSDRSNIKAFQKRGSLKSKNVKLSRLVKDAMALAYSVGIDYLWVDSLCIVQDSPNKHDLLARMDTIYSHATVTIAAIESESAHNPLPGIDRKSRYSLHPALRIGRNWFHTRPSSIIDAYLQSTIYNSRAWTFQELILSTRCIYMTNQQVFFRCRSGVWAETNPTKQLGVRADMYARMLQNISGGNRLQAYREFVHDYSARRLSFEEDVLNAFSGITSIFASAQSWRFVEGVLLQHLASEILFIHETQPIRRVLADRKNGFPSWSWAGWNGRVRWNPSDMDMGEAWKNSWRKLCKSRTFILGPSTMQDVEICLPMEATSRLQAQGAVQAQYSQEAAPDALALSKTVKISRAQGPFDKLQGLDKFPAATSAPGSPSTALLQFQARTIPATKLNIELQLGDQTVFEQGICGPAYHIRNDDTRVGVLFGVESRDVSLIRLEDQSFNIVQVTSNGALLVKRNAFGHDERVGVAFFWEDGTFDDISPRLVSLA